jgi:hypothetical protein
MLPDVTPSHHCCASIFSSAALAHHYRIYWISPLRYAFEALSLNELVGETYSCTAAEFVPPAGTLLDTPFPEGYSGNQACPITQGETALDLLDFPTTLSDRWYYLLALFGFFVFFQAASYFALRWIRFKYVLCLCVLCRLLCMCVCMCVLLCVCVCVCRCGYVFCPRSLSPLSCQVVPSSPFLHELIFFALTFTLSCHTDHCSPRSPRPTLE